MSCFGRHRDKEKEFREKYRTDLIIQGLSLEEIAELKEFVDKLREKRKQCAGKES